MNSLIPPIPVGALLFSDDFTGTAGSKPDSAKWNAPTNTSPQSGALMDGWNRISEDGKSNLVITARKNPSNQWVTGHMQARQGYTGSRYLEARVKMAGGYGTWNAPIWEYAFPWSSVFENDVTEQLGREPKSYHATLHNWLVSPQRQSGKTILTGVNLSAAFHRYGAAVYADHVDFYFDGVKKATTFASDVGLADQMVTTKMGLWITLNMGGWGGAPTISGPVSMLVDYVHVYRLP